MAVLLLAAGLACLPDALHALRRRLGRVGIGRWNTPESWAAAVERSALRQLRRMPVVPMSDQRFTLPERLRGQYRSREVQHRQHAVLAKARGRQSEAIETQEIIAQAGKSGTLPYELNSGLRLVDTLWMICPPLLRRAEAAGDTAAHDLALRQLEEYFRRGLHPQTGLPVHAFHVRTGAPLGLYGWARGTAYMFLALTESLACTQGQTQARLLHYARLIADRVIQSQLPQGGWDWLLSGSGTAESSATAMLGTGLALLAQALPKEDPRRAKYSEAALLARDCLLRLTRRDGTVDFAQGETNSIGLYSTRREPLPLAQAYALHLARLTCSGWKNSGTCL